MSQAVLQELEKIRVEFVTKTLVQMHNLFNSKYPDLAPVKQLSEPPATKKGNRVIITEVIEKIKEQQQGGSRWRNSLIQAWNTAPPKDIPQEAPLKLTEIVEVGFELNSSARSLIEQAIYILYWQNRNGEQSIKNFIKTLEQIFGVSTAGIAGPPAASSRHMIGAAIDIDPYITVRGTRDSKTLVYTFDFTKSAPINFKSNLVSLFDEYLTERAIEGLTRNYGISRLNIPKQVWRMVPNEPWHKELTDEAIKLIRPDLLNKINNAVSKQADAATFALQVFLNLYKAQQENRDVNTKANYLTTALRSAIAAAEYWALGPELVNQIRSQLDQITAARLGQPQQAESAVTSVIASFASLEQPVPVDVNAMDAYPYADELIMSVMPTSAAAKTLLGQLVFTAYYDTTLNKVARLLKELRMIITSFGQLPYGIEFTYPEIVTFLDLVAYSFNPFAVNVARDGTVSVGFLPPMPGSAVVTTQYILPAVELEYVDKKVKRTKVFVQEVRNVTAKALADYISGFEASAKKLLDADDFQDTTSLNYEVMRSVIERVIEVQAAYLKQLFARAAASVLSALPGSYNSDHFFSFTGLFSAYLAGNYTQIRQAFDKVKNASFFRQAFNDKKNYPITNNLLVTLINTFELHAKKMDARASRFATTYVALSREFEAVKRQIPNSGKPDWEAWRKALIEVTQDKSVEEALPPDLKARMLGHKLALVWQDVAWTQLRGKGLLEQFIEYLRTGDYQLPGITPADYSAEWEKFRQEFEQYKKEIDKRLGAASDDEKKKMEEFIKKAEELSKKAVKTELSMEDPNKMPSRWHIF